MAQLPTSLSCAVSGMICLIIFAGMQLFKTPLGSSKMMTIVGGFLGSQVFVFALTAINNFEAMSLSRGFQAKLFPEVIFAMLIGMIASGMVHRVCVTVCFIFSCIALYYLNNLSVSRQPAPVVPTSGKKGKKHN